MSAIGDTDAAADAGMCGTWVAGCAANIPDIYTGAAVRLMKQADGSWTLNGDTCTRSATPAVTTAAVRASVTRLIPAASIGLAPHDTSLVNIQTILWINTGTHPTLPPVQILGQRVRITLTLDHVTWTFGDNHTDVATTPGRPYEPDTDPCSTTQCPDYFGHTYTVPGRVQLTATASWTATFTVNNAAPTPIPGTLTGPTTTAALILKQARSVLTTTPGH